MIKPTYEKGSFYLVKGALRLSWRRLPIRGLIVADMYDAAMELRCRMVAYGATMCNCFICQVKWYAMVRNAKA